jgi:TonB family protein
MLFPTVARGLVLAFLASTQFQTLETTVAYQSKDVPPQSSNSAPKVGAGCTIELFSGREGVNFDPYLREVYLSVKKRWFANMPPSIEKGQQGKNTVEFRVLQDGNVPKDSVKMVSSSEKSDFDAVSLETIGDAAPFNHLPEKFSKSYIVVRFTFFYNLSPQKPH